MKRLFIEELKTKTPAEFVLKESYRELLSVPLNDNKETALHICAKHNILLIPLLLRDGAKANIKDRHGNTPLSYLMRLIQRLWVDPWIEMRGLFCDQSESDIYELAMSIAIDLIEKGAWPNTTNSYGMTLIHIAVANVTLMEPQKTHYFVDKLLSLKVNPALRCTKSIVKDMDAMQIYHHILLGSLCRYSLDQICFYTLALLANAYRNSRREYVVSMAELAEKHLQPGDELLDYFRSMSPSHTIHTMGQPREGVECFSYVMPAPTEAALIMPNFGTKPSELLNLLYKEYPELKDIFRRQGILRDKLNDADFIFTRISTADLRLALGSVRKTNTLSMFALLIYLLNDRCNNKSQSLFKRLPWDVVRLILTKIINTAFVGAIHAEYEQIRKWLVAFEKTSVLMRVKYKANTFVLFKSAESSAREFNQLPSDTAGSTLKSEYRRQSETLWHSGLALMSTANEKLVYGERLAETKLFNGVTSQKASH